VIAAKPMQNQTDAAQSLEGLIGNTPLITFPRITAHLPENVRVFGKAEWFNPGGSVKDRPALAIIRDAEQRGMLHAGVTLLDSTSGNMGIAYAMLGAARGHRVKLVVPANASPERLMILRLYGAELELSDPAEGSDGAIRRVQAIYEAGPEKYFYTNQYSNPANWQAHYQTTAPEIWDQTAGTITHFVVGLGTSGTLMGAGRRLKELNPTVKLVAFQPDSPFHGLEGLKHMPTAIVPAIYDPTLADETGPMTTEDAHRMCRRLAREEGLLVGVSAGAAVAVALRVAEGLAKGVVVTILPDGASKYLSEAFWQEGD